MKNILAILFTFILISCGSEEKNSHTKTERRISLIQGEPVKLEYGLQSNSEQKTIRIMLNKTDLNLKTDLELAHFVIDDNSGDVRVFSRSFKTHYLSKHNYDFKSLPWTEKNDAIDFNAHRKLNFSYDSRTQGYPSLKDSYVFIEMNDSHNEQSFKLVLDMYCPQGEQLRPGYTNICANNYYKLRIKIFDITRL